MSSNNLFRSLVLSVTCAAFCLVMATPSRAVVVDGSDSGGYNFSDVVIQNGNGAAPGYVSIPIYSGVPVSESGDTTIPEPTSLVLSGLALLAGWMSTWRRRGHR
jgi:hypothetical protein